MLLFVKICKVEKFDFRMISNNLSVSEDAH